MQQPVLLRRVKGYLNDLDSRFELVASVSPVHRKRKELMELLELISMGSPNISYRESEGKGLEFSLWKDNVNTGIKYRSTPNGQEFSTLILAILNADGKGKLPEDGLIKRIRGLRLNIKFSTYITLDCENCSGVVETLNQITLLNENISHEIIDGNINKMEVIEKEIKVLPSVYVNNDLFFVGKIDMREILEKLEKKQLGG